MIWVLLYRDTDNPLNIPPEWPAKVKQSDAEMSEPWIKMTPDEYADYREQHSAAYKAWKAEYDRQQQEEEDLSAKDLALELAKIVDELAPNRLSAKVKKEIQRKANR